MGRLFLGFPDPTGQIGSSCSQASFVPSSEGSISAPQKPVNFSSKPWFLVSPDGDGPCVGDVGDAFADVGGDRLCVFLNVCVVVVCRSLLEHVCFVKTVL